MSVARDDFLLGMCSLESATARIGTPSIGTAASRSAEYLQLNGLHVVAFALLEDFLRRRTKEVLADLGRSKVRFESFPEALKLHLLQETFKGINFYVGRKNNESRLDTLLVESLSLYTAADNKTNFVPSDFCFGKSQSNVSLKQIISFLESFGVATSPVFSKIMELIGLEHLGSPEDIFTRLADNRNAAAHAFNVDFDLVNFLNDIRISYRLIAFLFDTVISQSALAIKRAVNDIASYQRPTGDSIPFRSIRFDSIKKEWRVLRRMGNDEQELDAIKEKGLTAKLEAIKRGKHDKDDTVYVINFDGGLHNWLQPL